MMKPQVAVCFIFFLSASVSGFSIFGSSKTKVDDFAVDDDTAEVVSSIIPFSQIPPTSFVKATLVSETSRPKEVVIEVQSKFNKPSKCETIEFLNMPKSLNTMSTNIFKQVDKKYNHHVAYTNGKEFLSYVDEGDHGTWILGMNPGVDSGYVYIRPKHDSLVPVGLESGSKWKWSVEKEWITYDDIKVVCNDYVDDDLPSSNFFFQVGMYNGNSDEMTKLIMTASPSSSSEAILFSLSSDDETIYLRDFKVVCSMGKTVRIHDTKNGRSTLARMVNHELGADQSWRITFRRANSHLHFSNSNPLPKLASAIKTTENDDQVWDNKSEVRLRLKSDGSIIENFTLNPLRVNEYLRNYRRQVSDIQSTQVGDYLWTWMRHSYSTNISTQFLGSVVGDEEGALLAPPTDSIEEVFLMCVGKSDTHWLFRHYPFNRRDQMQQSILSRDTELVQIAISPSGTSTTASQTCSSGTRSNALITAFEGLHDHNVSSLDQLSIHVEDGANMITKHYHLLDVMFVGRNPMTLIKNYIYDVEGVLAEDVSSCYMYHAGVSIPASLIYATEVMCVLIGAKPVNLVCQYIYFELLLNCIFSSLILYHHI